MKIAVLGNGPSRTSFQNPGDYDLIIGCNVPWTEDVHCTVVVDEEIVNAWAKQPTLIKVPTYFSVKAWMQTDAIRKRAFFQDYFAGLISVEPKIPFKWTLCSRASHKRRCFCY